MKNTTFTSELDVKEINISLLLWADENQLLSQSSQRSGRSKKQEATLRLCDHLKAFADLPKFWSQPSKQETSYREVNITIQLNEEDNRLLTSSAARSGRSKKMEAMLRLSHHLKTFADIAAEGKRFISSN
ncbi:MULTISPECIES: TraY domain-containing protein [Serratia]|jgi:transposase|uniref:TraY domain-containing protein n=1 Tax=Serratia TaxID=613 RepID=UPI001CBACCB6|nr:MULTISPECIES: TraY domain-containing protein [Serratia]